MRSKLPNCSKGPSRLGPPTNLCGSTAQFFHHREPPTSGDGYLAPDADISDSFSQRLPPEKRDIWQATQTFRRNSCVNISARPASQFVPASPACQLIVPGRTALRGPDRPDLCPWLARLVSVADDERFWGCDAMVALGGALGKATEGAADAPKAPRSSARRVCWKDSLTQRRPIGASSRSVKRILHDLF